jgi:uncharacterized integral membrane protein
MKRLWWLITAPLALIVIAFAIANRRAVVLSIDPFSLNHPALAFDAPLWVLLFVAFFVGLLVGGAATWLARTHGELRRAARRREQIRAAQAPDPLQGVPAISANPEAAPMISRAPAGAPARRG